MEADPTARHSLLGPFQRVCYLVHGGARTHRSNPWRTRQLQDQCLRPVTRPTDTGHRRSPARARALEAKLVHLQPGRLAIRPAANDRLATRSGSGSAPSLT
jgi:hypothetical protein